MMSRSLLLVALLTLCLVAVPFAAHAQEELINLVLNPSFEDETDVVDSVWDADKWKTWGEGDGLPSVVEYDEDDFIDGTRSVRVEPVGSVDWHFMIIYDPVLLDFGEPYTVSFWAKSAEKRQIGVHMKDTGNVGSFGYTPFTTTPEWSEYYFTADAQQASIKLEIFVSDSEVTVWFDFVHIYAGEYVEGIMPSELGGSGKPVEPAGKLAVTWAELKLAQ